MAHRIGLATIFLFFAYACSFSQARFPDRKDQVMSDRISYIMDLHDSIIGVDKNLVGGEMYYPHRKNARNHPFYQEESWIRGSVKVSGEVYKDLLLRYDIVTDQALMLHISDGAMVIVLNKNDITGFTLEDVSFVRLNREGVFDNKDFNPGYYQEVYKGDLQLYAKWLKQRSINNGFLPDEFKQEIDLLLVKDDTYQVIKNDKDLRNILEDRKQEIRRYMQKNNIHVRLSTPEQLGTVISYYEQLRESGK